MNKFDNYNLENYINDIKNLGLEQTWDLICQYVTELNGNVSDFLNIKNFGELYEIGLAIQNKFLKKQKGQYYTPEDVAEVMSSWLKTCEGDVVCDVACGTGKLILTYLDLIGTASAKKLISSGNLYLYDSDNIALKICYTTLAIKYGIDIAKSIHVFNCDFLDNSISLPENAKVISNPPYAQIEEIKNSWSATKVLKETKELYSCFMEKIFSQAKSTVIITPFSFISGSKFKSLRKEMCNLGNGFIVAFDNVPGTIFCGRKQGIFNTNTANSVRAAITVFNKSSKQFGFKVSPLIRFKNEERKELLKCDVLEKTLSNQYQIITDENTTFKKIDNNLLEVFNKWTTSSENKVKDFVVKNTSNYLIDIPNTCRYFTVASAHKLSRMGFIILNIEDEDKFNFLYCFINSSFAYWWWRIYDGGIIYPSNLLKELPVPYNLLTDSDKAFFAEMAKEMIEKEKDFIVTKINVGIAQENIKFPEKYRDQINNKILQILGFNFTEDIFKQIHANKFFTN